MRMDETLYKIANKVKNFAVIYLVDISEVPDFNKMYELYDPATVMFFFRNKHIMVNITSLYYLLLHAYNIICFISFVSFVLYRLYNIICFFVAFESGYPYP